MATNTLKDLCKLVSIEAKYGAAKSTEGWPANGHHYSVTLKFQDRQLTTDFHMGSAHTSEPTSEAVLECLLSDASAGEQTFEDFCADFGMDTDSRKAEAMWKACASMAKRLPKFLGSAYNVFQIADR